MTQETLKLALEALEACNRNDMEEVNEAITAIKEALAQPEQEPTNIKRHEANVQKFLGAPKPKEQEPEAWMYQEYRDDDQFGWRDEILFTPPPNDPIYFRNITPVYTIPQRTWVGLTDEEIDQGLLRTPYALQTAEAWREGVRWAYHQLKEKNI